MDFTDADASLTKWGSAAENSYAGYAVDEIMESQVLDQNLVISSLVPHAFPRNWVDAS